MDSRELTFLLNNNNLAEKLEKNIINDVLEKNMNDNANPFQQEEIKLKTVLNTIIYCTILLALLIQILYNKQQGNN